MVVKLKIKGSDEVREFEKTHALRVLRLRNSVFELTQDSPFEFIDNEFKRRASKGDSKKPTTKVANKRSGKASK